VKKTAVLLVAEARKKGTSRQRFIHKNGEKGKKGNVGLMNGLPSEKRRERFRTADLHTRQGKKKKGRAEVIWNPRPQKKRKKRDSTSPIRWRGEKKKENHHSWL